MVHHLEKDKLEGQHNFASYPGKPIFITVSSSKKNGPMTRLAINPHYTLTFRLSRIISKTFIISTTIAKFKRSGMSADYKVCSLCTLSAWKFTLLSITPWLDVHRLSNYRDAFIVDVIVLDRNAFRQRATISSDIHAMPPTLLTIQLIKISYANQNAISKWKFCFYTL